MSSTAEKRRFIRLSSKFDYKSGQWSADFTTVVRVHKPSSCPTDYTFCFEYRFLPVEPMKKENETKSNTIRGPKFSEDEGIFRRTCP